MGRRFMGDKEGSRGDVLHHLGSRGNYYHCLVGCLGFARGLCRRSGPDAEQRHGLTIRGVHILGFSYPHAYPSRRQVDAEFPALVSLTRPAIKELEGFVAEATTGQP